MFSYRESIAARRLFSAVILIALLALALPQPAAAAPGHDITLSFDVVAVKKSESVTIKMKDFPVRTKFTLKMAKVGKKAVDGAVIAEFNTEKGGTFEKTFQIPENLKNELIIAIRVDSVDHYAAENWFFNEDKYAKVTDKAKQPAMTFSGVQKDTSFKLEVKNLVPNTAYLVRVGPHYTFYRDYVSTGTIKSDAEGVISADITMPKAIKDKAAEYVMVRLDGAGNYAVASFQNVNGGGVVEQNKLTKVVYCQLINLNWIQPLQPGEEFDVVWTVQNTGPTDWNVKKLLYKYVSGEETYKYKNWYPVGWTVKRGWSFDIAVDMIAPQEVGWHRTTWALMDGDTTLCKLPVSFAVESKK